MVVLRERILYSLSSAESLREVSIFLKLVGTTECAGGWNFMLLVAMRQFQVRQDRSLMDYCSLLKSC